MVQLRFEQQNKHPFIDIYLDETLWKTVHGYLFSPISSLKTSFSDLNEWESYFYQKEFKGAFRKVLKKLSLRSYLSAELRDHLTSLLVTPQTIDKVLERCSELGYLNDQQNIENFIKSLSTRKQGPRAILVKLRNRGVEESIAREAVQNFFQEIDVGSQIKQLLETKYRTKDLTDFKVRNNVVASLMRKGFDLDDIFKSLK